MRSRNLLWIVLGAVLCCILPSTAAWGQSPFIRGDVNCDGVVDANDITALQNFIFNGVAVPCDDAADVNDDGLIDLADLTALTNFVSTGGPIPPPPFPNCGLDPTPDALGCSSFCCGNGSWEHYKTWQLQFSPFSIAVTVVDQFMADELIISGLEFLSNPARKDSFQIIHPDDHLTWYRASGRDTLLEVEYYNQFEHDSVLIDRVEYLLLPTQKLPHPPPDPMLDHYKAYHIANPQWFLRPTLMEDQFLADSEIADSMRAVYFLTPASKNGNKVYDTVRHYVAYEYTPQTATTEPRTTVDQFGAHDVLALQSRFLLVPTLKVGFHPPGGQADTLKNHFKSWRVDPIGAFSATAIVEDQFMADDLVLENIEFLSNPARKDTSDIKRPNDHLNWYKATGRDTLLQIEYDNQFGTDTLIVDRVSHLLVPCRKDPHPAPDSLLGHYKAYRVASGHTYFNPTGAPVEIEDQFDSFPELIDSIVPRYFLNPAIKNGEPAFGPDTHYVAYEIFPKTIITQTRLTDDQFGTHQLAVFQSELLLVPSHKIAYYPPPVADTLRNHFKTWRIDFIPFEVDVNVSDQFMTDVLTLQGLTFLSNPAKKDTSGIKRPDDHLNWYRATGRDTLLNVVFENQFELDTILIDSVRHLLVPCQKLPHNPPDTLLGHYKSYHIRDGHVYRRADGLPIEVLDQFDAAAPELIDSVLQVFFLVPCTKNTEPITAADTHYVAYEIFPKTDATIGVTTIDQFGAWNLTARRSVLLLVPSHKISFWAPPPADTAKNHFKTWRLEPQPFDAMVDVRDQFTTGALRLGYIDFLSNPARKDNFDIVLPDDHLLWYTADGRDTCLEIVYSNQFGVDTFVVGTVSYLLVPAQKLPHPPPDPNLDHYKAYKVWRPSRFVRPTQLQDQFDIEPENINELEAVYFLTPASKNGEPIHDDSLHYVAYNIYPKQDSVITRQTIDQFGTHVAVTKRSEMLLVPTEKLEFHYFCPILKPGDVNMDLAVTSADIIYLVNYVFKGGPPPLPCPAAGDVNCDGAVTSADIIYLVNYVFKGGPPPCDPCTIIPSKWICPC